MTDEHAADRALLVKALEALSSYGSHYDPITEHQHCSDCGCKFGEDENGDYAPYHHEKCEINALLSSPEAKRAMEEQR
jgi:hypothetical protein